MKWQLTLQIGINDCPGDKAIDRYCQSEGGREGTGEKEGEIGDKRGKKQMEKQGMVGDDAAHRQTTPTGHCLLCLRSTIVSAPINLLACCARAGRDGRIQNDRHGPMTWEVRSGFNRGLGALGTQLSG